MNILLTIAHHAEPTALRGEQLMRCLVGWRGLAEWGTQDFGGPCVAHKAHQLDIVVVDDGVHTATEYMSGDLADVAHVAGDPLRLPLTCRAMLDELRGRYDLLCYSEHDNWPVTPDFFDQAQDCATMTNSVLIPHRFERISVPPYKVYIDGENGYGAYGAMWAVSQAQWSHWRTTPHFLTYTAAFAGPLESGCAWSLMQTFTCVKVNGVESEHIGDRYARRSVGRGVVWQS